MRTARRYGGNRIGVSRESIRSGKLLPKQFAMGDFSQRLGGPTTAAQNATVKSVVVQRRSEQPYLNFRFRVWSPSASRLRTDGYCILRKQMLLCCGGIWYAEHLCKSSSIFF